VYLLEQVATVLGVELVTEAEPGKRRTVLREHALELFLKIRRGHVGVRFRRSS
jgi:hypothetical protein